SRTGRDHGRADHGGRGRRGARRALRADGGPAGRLLLALGSAHVVAPASARGPRRDLGADQGDRRREGRRRIPPSDHRRGGVERVVTAETVVGKDKQEHAALAAELLARAIESAVARRGVARVALSGGTTPAEAYRTLRD